jgi:chaperonin GroEL
MALQSPKVKSAAKIMLPRGDKLQDTILSTLKTCSDIVGSTLGPGGRSVIIEHAELNMPPIVTKDGVTVFRHMAFQDSTKHVIMEAVRDTSTRTASEAGDGTTTATILAESFVRYTIDFCRANPHISPQRVVHTLQVLFKNYMEPAIRGIASHPTLANAEGRAALRAVAKVSANGDDDLASAVMDCFEIVGDEGNVTLTESSGPSRYVVQKIDGYPVSMGFEDACGPFYQKFVNDPATQSCFLEEPMFLLHHGTITDINTLVPIMEAIAAAASFGEVGAYGKKITTSVVVAATGFNEFVLANFAAGFTNEGALRVYPLKIPMFPVRTGNYDFLMDLASLTGGRIFDPLEYPLQNFQLSDLGQGPRVFEATRFRSNIIGRLDDERVLERVDQIQKQLTDSLTSEQEKTLMRERVAKLTSGIARLIIQGSSNGEVKERRDRAEDAVCAIRGAIKHGALPGGGVTLATLSAGLGAMKEIDPDVDEGTEAIARQVAAQALLEPVRRLFLNSGYDEAFAQDAVNRMNELETFDLYNNEWVDPNVAGILDSLPAVLEAVRNSISIAPLLSTCGGTIVFPRDYNLELEESKATAEWLRHSNINEANLRP